MPKKNKAKPKPVPQDGYFLLRLPETYRDLLRSIQDKTHRTMTVDAQIALERFAKHQGVEFTPNYPRDL
jgi:hypothetical protein